jgi:hypothetical protein
MYRTILLLALALVALLGIGVVACIQVQGQSLAAAPSDTPPEWICDPNDCICGLSDPRMLSHPALVRYEPLFHATPEIQKMHREGIDPDSPAGLLLREAARARLQRACEAVRVESRHCSVWKHIRHRDGRAIPDVTELVRARLGSS